MCAGQASTSTSEHNRSIHFSGSRQRQTAHDIYCLRMNRSPVHFLTSAVVQAAAAAATSIKCYVFVGESEVRRQLNGIYCSCCVVDAYSVFKRVCADAECIIASHHSFRYSR